MLVVFHRIPSVVIPLYVTIYITGTACSGGQGSHVGDQNALWWESLSWMFRHHEVPGMVRVHCNAYIWSIAVVLLRSDGMAESIFGPVNCCFDWSGVPVTTDEMGGYATLAGPGKSCCWSVLAVVCVDMSYRPVVPAYSRLTTRGYCIVFLVCHHHCGHISRFLSRSDGHDTSCRHFQDPHGW